MKLSGPQRLAWLAALIDGEGSIMLTRRVDAKSQQTEFRMKPRYRASIVVANTDMRLMDELASQTGITRIYKHRINGDPKTPMKRAQYTWRMANEDIRLWLPKIRPYLVLKQSQADLLLEAMNIKTSMTPGNEGFRPINRVLLNERLMAVYLEIRNLNTRGRVVIGELDA